MSSTQSTARPAMPPCTQPPTDAPRDALRTSGLRAILAPRSVALVGASRRNLELVANVRRGSAEAVGIHPSNSEVAGLQCVPSLKALLAPPELAVLAVGPATIAASMRDALALGVRSFVVPGLGVESGADGPAAVRELHRIAEDSGAAVLGPNCMGSASPDSPSAWLGTIPASFLPGSVAIVSQSGSIADAFLALGPRYGFSGVVSCGAELNRDAADWVAHFAADPATRVIGLFLETVRRPHAFRRALRVAAEAGKPVVCLKIGRSEQARRAALAHTGAIVGSHAAFSAVLRSHGVLQVDDLPEMIELLGVFSTARRPTGGRIGAVTESGAEAALLGDHAERNGLTFPALPESIQRRLRSDHPLLPTSNPLDPWAIAEPVAAFSAAIEALADAGQYDLLIGQVDLSRHRGETEQTWCGAVVRALAEAGRRTHTFTAVTTVHHTDPPEALARYAAEHDVCLLKGIGPGLTAIARAVAWSAGAGLPDAAVPPPRTADIAGRLTGLPAGPLSEFDSSALLERGGVAFARRLLAESPDDAVEAAGTLGFPVVVKTDGPAHKARAGGVMLNLNSPEAVSDAATRLAGRVLVAEQVAPALEVFCGMVRDPVWGPVYALGRGGTQVESTTPVTFVGPLTPELVRLMISRAGLETWQSLLAVALLAMDALARGAPRIGEIDINPVVCAPDGTARAVDALIVLTADASPDEDSS
ncbi:acetate--CoA ligase family protein [Streptomyces tibetensis]|uniref:Acetate--CoA ligase family protein n=1 Tax=Streptomyces tibetensis TaxID=2382123 RepID=A0ABW6MPF8_9ACTN